MGKSYILAAVLVLLGLLGGGFLSGGIYESNGGGTYIVNRFTGTGYYCAAMNCFPLIRHETGQISK